MSKFLNIKPLRFHLKIILSILLLVVIMLILTELLSQPSPNLKFGVTFSPSYATYLGLDWKKTYQQILTDLKVKRIRIPTYWREIELADDQLNFADTDYLLNQAKENNAQVILVIGMKQPRWPECQIPDWARSLTTKERQQQVLWLVEAVVNRYKTHPAIWAYQVENEPLFGFGEDCDKADRKFLKQEVDLVKILDPKKPIIITDTGEWRAWITPMRLSDILGVSLYRFAYIQGFGPLDYHLPKLFYRVKSAIIRPLFAPTNTKTIITELQTEPWSDKGLRNTPVDQQLKLMTIDKFMDNITFAKNTGFDEIYFWGVEWWIYLTVHNHPEYWEYAKTLF